MHNFFTSDKNGNQFVISGKDYNHIKNVLRFSVGQEILVSFGGKTNLCRIADITDSTVLADLIEENYRSGDNNIKIYLFQGIPKADKMELIVQKSVELGVHKIIPTEMSRCVVKLDAKKRDNKISRWQSISESAAKQSKCSAIPEILPPMSFSAALNFAATLDMLLIPYESKNGMADTVLALSDIKRGMNIGVLIGPEGGFSDEEILQAEKIGRVISLGIRILRTETAAIASVAMCMLRGEMLGE